MSYSINELLSGTCIAPSTGKAIVLPIKRIEIGSQLVGHAGDLLASLNIGAHYTLVCDNNTYDALGKALHESLGNTAKLITLHGTPKADTQTVEHLRKASAQSDALIAVGSGTINDLCKYASHLDNKPYAVFATAPSMNGYASANASITMDGFKSTLPAQMPAGIFMDTEILRAAPKRLIRSGLGDSLCRPTAQFDWLLSHLLLGTSYMDFPFQLLAADEPALFADSAGLVRGDTASMERLARTLILSGIGMTLAGGSYPASQGEHLIAHTMEMAYGDELPVTYHGEQIGVTTLTMAQKQWELLENDTIPNIKSPPQTTEITAYFNHTTAEACYAEIAKKRKVTLAISSEQWAEIKLQLKEVLLPLKHLEKTLQNCGAPVTPGTLGWESHKYENAVNHAWMIRDRLTTLDFAF